MIPLRSFRRTRPATGARQNRQIYLTAVLLGLLSGGLIIYYQKHPPILPNNCKPAPEALAQVAAGEVAAFIPSGKARLMPTLTFEEGNGGKRSLEEFRGKTVLLNLWATWCVPCREEMPALDALQQKRGMKDFTVLAISLDAGGADKPKQFFAEYKIRFLSLFSDNEGVVFKNLREIGIVTGLPASFLLDKNGCLLGTLAGPAKWDSDEALKLIDAAKKITP